mgnify:CR=1 FL=1
MNVNDLYNAQFGGGNPILIDDTAEHTGPFYAITALTGTVRIDVSECTTNITDAVDFTIPNGTTIYGNFSSIELEAGGVALAYYKPQ